MDALEFGGRLRFPRPRLFSTLTLVNMQIYTYKYAHTKYLLGKCKSTHKDSISLLQCCYQNQRAKQTPTIHLSTNILWCTITSQNFMDTIYSMIKLSKPYLTESLRTWHAFHGTLATSFVIDIRQLWHHCDDDLLHDLSLTDSGECTDASCRHVTDRRVGVTQTGYQMREVWQQLEKSDRKKNFITRQMKN